MAGITQFQEFKKDSLIELVNLTVKSNEETFVDRYLPNKDVFSSTFVYDLIKATPHIASIIGYGAEAPVADRNAFAKIQGEVAKMGLKHVVTEEEMLAIYNSRSNAEKRAVVDSLVVKASDLVDAVLKRVYVMKMEALTKGTFTYNANGVKASVDFGVPAGNKVVLTGTNKWDDTTGVADILGNLITWVQSYETVNNGKSPNEILMSRQVMALVMKNSGILKYIYGTNAQGVKMASESAINELFGSFSLPPVRIVKSLTQVVRNVYTGVDETITVYPSNRVILVGEGVGDFLYGPTVENGGNPGIYLKAYDKEEPQESIIKVVSAGFPAVKTPELLFFADVI